MPSCSNKVRADLEEGVTCFETVPLREWHREFIGLHIRRITRQFAGYISDICIESDRAQ